MTDIREEIKNFPKRKKDAHKGDFGHAFIIAGSAGYTGAAYLSGQAAARSGAGLVTVAAAESIYPVLAAKFNEVMVRPVPETPDSSPAAGSEKAIMAFADKCTSVAIGPGLSRNKETARLVRNLVLSLNKPVILDADGINAFAGHEALLKKAKAHIVLTPHAGELSELSGIKISDIRKDRKNIALKLACEYNSVLVLKGQGTVVAGPDGRCYVNTTGNPGMATGGAGDVLTGIIASFAAQGMKNFSAAILGTYFHGLSGDLALKEKGPLGLIATDILDKLPEALKALA